MNFAAAVKSDDPEKQQRPRRKLQKSPPRGGRTSVQHAPSVSTPSGHEQSPQILTRSLSAGSSSPARPQAQPCPTIRSAASWMTRRKTSTASQPGGPDEGGAGEPKSPTIAGPRYEDPKREHKPKTGGKEESVYVLTLKLSDEIAGAMNEMREQWFPKHLNRTPAHLTLFHALPHSQLETIESYLDTAAAYMKPFRIVTGSPFRMRRGVGIGIRSGVQEAKVLHDRLRNEWIDFLSDQDSGGWRPHWTVMNKENDAERVKEAFETLDESLKRDEIRGVAVGMDLWKYNKGDWDFFKEYEFVGDENGQYPSDTSVSGPSVAAGYEQNSNSSHPGVPVKGRRMSK